MVKQLARGNMDKFQLLKCLFAVVWALLTMPNMAGASAGVVLEYHNDPCTTMTITWENPGQGLPYLTYTPLTAANSPATLRNADIHKIATNIGEKKLAVVELDNLSAGMTYSYRLSDGSAWIMQGAFTTQPRETNKLKFIVFGDSQCSRLNYSIWGRTIDQAYRCNPDAAFFVNIGDLVDNGGDYAQWHEWLKNALNVSCRLPLVPVIGNHETRYCSGFSGKALTENLLFTNSGKLRANDTCAYSFDYAGIHIVVIDTEAMLNSDRQAFAEINWLAADLKAAQTKPKLVFMHRPLYNFKFFESAISTTLGVQLQPLFEKYAVRAVFAGHVHQNSRTVPMKLVFDDNYGVRYFTCGRSGAKKYPSWITTQSAKNSFYYSPALEPTYMTVEVDGNNIFVKTYLQSGKEIDSTII